MVTGKPQRSAAITRAMGLYRVSFVIGAGKI
jgi:hypothetical protein